jgi:hypothetical protein
LFNTAYGVVKAGKPFSDYELICEIQVKNGLDLGENYRNINGCKTFAAIIWYNELFTGKGLKARHMIFVDLFHSNAGKNVIDNFS